ncbi:flagellar biosynthesis anti-sigma factor FlgM [Sediminibacillus albus]|uniref:Negative regulator of flagellin synthesis n=1 Tax=Sediminibacillus albus TaxID=407036 RepID=A0A1G8YLV1_9BACI|nr:flagellar biosynthesis anti-sigma factor FlgM [Sediminibacillus albus]SDK03839.1 negative regulator of flagellin synthesis FlgM [Sediminibacillus albus]
MKIQGPNHSNFNPYQKQMQKQADLKKELTNQADQLQISNQAKQLQETAKPDPARQERVQEIKQAVESGEYKIDPKQTARKMVEFWNNQP